MAIKDSGNRTQFASGAVRDIQQGKGRCDLLPLEVIAELYAPEDKLFFLCVNNALWQRETGYLYKALATFIKQYFPDRETALLETAIHFEEGAAKYSANNWRQGIPLDRYIDSAIRHFLKFKRGDTDERHDRAVCWNLMCAIWTLENKGDLCS